MSNFNPNNGKYNKIYPTYENLTEEVTDLEIYKYYIGDFTIGKPFKSPLIKDDKPSFGIFPSKKYTGSLFFKDHRGPSGGSITFVKELFNISYKEALERVVIDFNLEDKFIVIDNSLKQLKPVEYRLDKNSREEYLASKLDLEISTREWRSHDIDYWKKQGISIKTLKLFNVVPIKYYWMYGRIYVADKYAYAYKEYKDDILNYKVYQPYRLTNNHKFLNGFLDGTFSGWELLPKDEIDLLIITKSTKDAMFLYEHGYYAISPQGEGYTFKPQVIEILKSKTKRIITLYDHDFAGITAAERNRKEFGFEFVTTCDFKNKDATDFYVKNGLTETINLLNLIFK